MAVRTNILRRATHHTTIPANIVHLPKTFNRSNNRIESITRHYFHQTTRDRSSSLVNIGPRRSSQSIFVFSSCLALLGLLGFTGQTRLDSPGLIFDNSIHPETQSKSLSWKGKTHAPLDLRAASAKIKTEETINKPPYFRGTGVSRFDTVRVASNHPVEDDYSYDSATVGEGKPWQFWGVYDGHAGWATSTVLRIALASCVVHELRYMTQISRSLSSKAVEHAIQSAFLHLDDEIVYDGLEALTSSRSHAEALSRIAPARAGSCALLAAFNPNTSILHVACTGDSRAVLGRFQAKISDQDSTSIPRWTAEALSIDQTGFNEKERLRINAEHPDEADVIDIKTGRILGLAVTRAFGDHRWKWPLEALERAKEGFFGSSPRPKYSTPPYLTAEPVVTMTKISTADFLIMASDGFWDHVSSEDAVECVSMWIRHAKGEGSNNDNKSSLSSSTSMKLPPQSPSTTTNKLPAFPTEFKSTPADFVVEDDNVATHLARNALGGSRRELFCSVMSMQPPESRSVRDDMTIQVIFFGNVL